MPVGQAEPKYVRAMNRTSPTRYLDRWKTLRLVALLFALFVLSRSTFALSSVAAGTGPAQVDSPRVLALYEAVLPDAADDVHDLTDGKLSIYDVDATLTPISHQPARLSGKLHLTYHNISDESQSELYLRLYPNGDDYGGASIVVSDVRLAGKSVSATTGSDDTLVSVSFGSPLAPNRSIDLSLAFETVIPTDPPGSYGMFAYYPSDETYNLAHWLPLLAGWDPAEGWLTGPVNRLGDPVFSNAALFDVTLLAPSSFEIATSGVLVDERSLGPLTELHWTSGPSRDFVMAASPRFEALEEAVGETVVRSLSLPGYEAPATDVLEYAADSLRIFNEHFGEYPFKELDVVQARLGDRAAGVEFPGIVYIGSSLYEEGNSYLEFTVSHEIAHQWWYGVVGNNQYLHAFLDEGLANQSAIIYKERKDGAEAANQWVDRYLLRPYLSMLFGEIGDQIVDQPTVAFPSDAIYGRTVYAKGALGFAAIRESIGDADYFLALRKYVEENLFGVGTPTELLTAFNEVSGEDLTGLWRHWFEETDGLQDFTPADLEAVNG
jgi:hypothetical protein